MFQIFSMAISTEVGLVISPQAEPHTPPDNTSSLARNHLLTYLLCLLALT